MNTISYNIISYDPQNLGLIKITQKVVTEFLGLVGVHPSIQCLECRDCGELENEWTIPCVEQSERLHFKAKSRFESTKGCKKWIFITSIDIGNYVGITHDNNNATISSCQVKDDMETFSTGMFHELGHMHDIPSLDRKKLDNHVDDDAQIILLEQASAGKDAIFERFGEHCLNSGCSMRQRLTFQNWIDHLTKERIEIGRAYCKRCLADLKGGFQASFSKFDRK